MNRNKQKDWLDYAVVDHKIFWILMLVYLTLYDYLISNVILRRVIMATLDVIAISLIIYGIVRYQIKKERNQNENF